MSDARPHFVLAHGFTQTARSWAPVETLLRERVAGCRVTAVDLPGHGDAAGRAGDLWDAADRLVASGGAGIYLGYSMGGRVALHAALAHPDDVDELVLIGTTAGIEDAAERDARRVADEALADRIEEIGVRDFVDEWLRNPLFAGLDAASAGAQDRYRNTATGLASSLRGTGTGTQQPLWDRLGEIRVPTLVLAGQHDAKFRALGERMAAGIPDASFAVVAGAGHTTHLERPEATVEAVLEWRAALSRR